MKLCHIVAASKNHVIGKGNDLPWHLPEDFKYFKDKTRHHPVIMGRLTYESINKKPLPNRDNLVVSRSLTEAEGFMVFQNIEQAVSAAKDLVKTMDEEIFIIGGGEIYKQTMDIVDRIYFTSVDMHIDEGEAFYPAIPEGFTLTSEDPREGFVFQVFDRTS